MDLELIRLTPDCKDRNYFEQINEEAFPISERMTMDDFFLLASETDADVLGIYDAGRPIGFAIVVKNEECGYVNYFAIDQNFRSKGYGGASLKKIFEAYSQIQIILDFEELDADAANIDQRIRRKNFYLRNGFHETGKYTLLRGNLFEVVCNKGALQEDAFKALIEVLHAHCPEFANVLM